MMQAAFHALRNAALDLGFSDVGVADAFDDQGTKLADWLADGCHGDMAWMPRHLPARLDPSLVLPDVSRVVILTYEYARRDARIGKGARIARYAQGEDYHKLLAPKLADLDELLSCYGGVQKCYTDSGPVSERFFAARAGLGWIGRNGLLIRPQRGSYCFLSSILTTLPLPAGSPMPNHCGSCHRCESACPTGALCNGRCDARRCLAYWTIEAKAPMPPDIAAAQGDRLYGCDTCQECCPWNNLASARAGHIDPHLLMPAPVSALDAGQFATLDEDTFSRLFPASPLRRTGLEHLRRNAGGEMKPDPD